MLWDSGLMPSDKLKKKKKEKEEKTCGAENS